MKVYRVAVPTRRSPVVRTRARRTPRNAPFDVRPPILRSGESARSSPPPRLTSVIVPVVTAVVPGLAAIEVRRVIRAPGSAVDRSPGVCAQRPGTQDALRGLVV